jgi:hypothetical protein
MLCEMGAEFSIYCVKKSIDKKGLLGYNGIRNIMAIEFGTLKTVDIRTIWPSEPGNFTPWLAENIDKLSNILERDLEIIQTEYAVGDFSADIVAKDLASSGFIVIENQYGVSDHKHLGQILLYCAGINASCMIWIAESFKDEHRKTIDSQMPRGDSLKIGIHFRLKIQKYINMK